MAVSQSSSSVTSHPFDGPPCHCSRRTFLVMVWTDANPGRQFYKCYLHGFFTWADREEPHGWQKQNLLEARDQIRRLREDKKSFYNEIAELEKQLALQATAERAQRPEEEKIDGQGMPNLVYSDREKVMRQFFLSWGDEVRGSDQFQFRNIQFLPKCRPLKREHRRRHSAKKKKDVSRILGGVT
ncbi:hypothetical protein Bca101_083669 [Brassica carinata]